jgi:hypothetical protein
MFRLLASIANGYRQNALAAFIHVPATPKCLAMKGPACHSPISTRALQRAVRSLLRSFYSLQGIKRRIVEYNPGWPGEFKEIAAQLQNVLAILALRIDHIGLYFCAKAWLAKDDHRHSDYRPAKLNEQLLAAMTAHGYTRSEIATSDTHPGRMSDKPL